MEKFTFCPISRKGSKVFNKKKMVKNVIFSLPKSYNFVDCFRGATVTGHQKGTGP